MTAIVIVLGFLGLVLSYLALIIFLPMSPVRGVSLEFRGEAENPAPDYRHDVEYVVGNEKIRSWLYMPPESGKPAPGIVLCNGFGGTKDMAFGGYCRRFAEAGIAALAIEYRHYGESDGSLRNVFDYRQQEEDLAASVEYLRLRPDIDPESIFIWGCSAAGGYGISRAAKDRRIAGVITLCPSLDHKKDGEHVFKREGLGYMLKLIVHAQRDKGRSRFGLSPHTIPAVGHPGTLAMLNAPGTVEGYQSIIPPGSLFENRLCARVMLMPHGTDPMEAAKNVECPVLLSICAKDTLTAPGSHESTATILGSKARVVTYPAGHFDLYSGEWFERAVADQIGFISGILEARER